MRLRYSIYRFAYESHRSDSGSDFSTESSLERPKYFNPIESVDDMKKIISTDCPATITSGRTATTKLYTLSGLTAHIAAAALMYGFRKRHGERRLNYGL